jgi:hypothetical protein
MDPKSADEFASRRVARIDEVVIVALEEVVTVLDQDDAVQHRPVEHLTFVKDDFADMVRGLTTDESKVVLVEEGLHTDAIGN